MSLWPAGKDSQGQSIVSDYQASSTINYLQLTKHAAVTITQPVKVTPAHAPGLLTLTSQTKERAAIVGMWSAVH